MKTSKADWLAGAVFVTFYIVMPLTFLAFTVWCCTGMWRDMMCAVDSACVVGCPT